MKNIRVSFFLALLSILSISTPGNTDEKTVQPPAETNEPAYHTHGGDWFTRLRVLYVYPNDSSGSVDTIPTAGVSVHPTWTGEFDLGYMFTKFLGSELILGTCRNSIWGTGTLAGTKIGSVWLLPPTLTLYLRGFPNYVIQPYVGGGVNFTVFYGEHCSLPGTKLDFRNSWGPAVQIGADFFFAGAWIFNVDVKYIWASTEAHLRGTTDGNVHVNVNPWLIGFGFGRKW